MMGKGALAIILFFFAAALSGIFSGAETGIYQLSRLRLRMGVEEKRFRYVLLNRIMRDSHALLISILIGTNLAHYLATSSITMLFLGKGVSEHGAEMLATLVATPILFVFCELIPKNIFLYRPDTLTGAVAPVLYVFHKALTLCGAIGLLKGISALFAKAAAAGRLREPGIVQAQSSYIKAILEETHEEGVLSPVQARIAGRLDAISRTNIRAVMTPMSRVEMVEVNSGRAELMGKLKRCAYTRLPVYERSEENIIGFINIYEVLSNEEAFSDLRRFVQPIRRLEASTVIVEAIARMQSGGDKIMLVTRSGALHGRRPIGIVTMKDLVEELLGELTEW